MKRRNFILKGAMGMIGGLTSVTLAGMTIKDMADPGQTTTTIPSFHGSPRAIGVAYGKQFAEAIERNTRTLLGGRIPANDPAFRSWVRSQEKLVGDHWPWYIEEMEGVAEGIAGKYEDVLLLNLRAWQYDIYGAPPSHACSSLAIKLANGQMACAGALDDPIELYCGPVHFAGNSGYRLITFPITGTSWGNRSMNSAGLAVGISSQILPGLKHLKNALVQDIAMRAMLQTCATVSEVRNFCLKHPFTMNLVCVDAKGGIFCAHQTSAGLREIKAHEGCAITNHVVDEDSEKWLRENGVTEFPKSPTTIPRRNKLLNFIGSKGGKCTASEVKELIAHRDDSDPASINNKGSIFLTYAAPQSEKSTFWILQPKLATCPDKFLPFEV